MKKLMLCVAITVFGMSVYAQEDAVKSNDVKFGLTAGYAGITEKAKVDGISMSLNESGFYFGVIAEFDLSDKTKLQPEVLYANAADTGFLYIPVLLKYQVAEKFYLLAGPQATLILEETNEEFNSFGIDLSFGLNYEVDENFFLEARYAFELTNRYNANDFDITDRINTIMVGVGYRF